MKKLLYINIFIALTLFFGPVCFDSSSAQADIKRAKKPEVKKKDKRFKHACPPGTEPFGAGPPHGDRIYCRQPVTGGSYRAHGTAIKWYGNGEKRHEGEFVRGKRHGVWTSYHRDGRKKSVQTFYNGERRDYIKFDADERPIKKEKETAQATDENRKKAFYWQKAFRKKAKKKRRRSTNSWTGGRRGSGGGSSWHGGR